MYRNMKEKSSGTTVHIFKICIYLYVCLYQMYFVLQLLLATKQSLQTHCPILFVFQHKGLGAGN